MPDCGSAQHKRFKDFIALVQITQNPAQNVSMALFYEFCIYTSFPNARKLHVIRKCFQLSAVRTCAVVLPACQFYHASEHLEAAGPFHRSIFLLKGQRLCSVCEQLQQTLGHIPENAKDMSKREIK